jgi:hypothetical protein
MGLATMTSLERTKMGWDQIQRESNGGFKCFDVAGDKKNDSHLEVLLACLGSMMDAVWLQTHL